MRPYLAVLSDSFYEAMHSRVLWILLGLILLLLLLLAPLTVTYPLTSQISNSDVRDLRQLAQALVAAEAASETDVRRVIWKKLDDELQKNLKKIAEVEDEENRNIGRELRVRSALASALNEIINDDAVFTDAQLSSLELPPEARRLADGPRYDEQQKRLHRLVMETCFPDQFESRTGRSTQIIYLIWPLGDQIPFGQQQVEQAIEFILAQFTNFFLGFIGVFVGILVTASIIPGTFESGSVNLLLSKPISRPLLYLTKVFGGCWFVLANCILLVVGVYVVSGVRLGVWNHRLPWCIPLFLFLFLIYYSVSALAGLIWRNTVVAIVLTILFWLLCTIVGETHETITALALNPKKLATVIPTRDQLLALTDTGRVQRWDKVASKWDEVFKEDVQRLGPAFAQRIDLVGPIYDGRRDQLLAIEQSFGAGKLFKATAEGEWKREAVGQAPAGCRHLALGNGGEVFAIGRRGLARLTGGEPASGVKLFGFSVPGTGGRGAFEPLGPTGFKLTDQATACVHLSRPVAYTVDKGELTRLVVAEDGKFAVDAQTEIGTDEDLFLVCAAGELVLVGDDEGRLRLFSGSELRELSGASAARQERSTFPLCLDRWTLVCGYVP